MIPYFELITINFGLFEVNVWGLMVALGFLTALVVIYREAKLRGLNAEYYLDLAIIVILAAIIGARLFYVLNEWSQFKERPVDILKFWEGGLAIYGGFMLAIFSGWAYLKIRKANFWKYFDTAVIALPLGIAIGRIGCFFIHDHLGRITNLPWGIETPAGVVRHETAMYEIIFLLAVFLIFQKIKKTNYINKQPGCLTALFLFFTDCSGCFLIS